jgi:hypothetical protein
MGSKSSKTLDDKTTASDIGTYVLVTIVFAVLGYFIIRYFFIDNVAPFVSEYDGKNYAVRKVGDISTKQTAANYLSVISNKIDTLVNYMHKHNLPDPNTAKRLYSRWSVCELKETNSTERSAAYTLNKSTEIRLCIRNSSGGFEDPNTSMFVVLHELGHVMSISYGHEEEFKNNFSYITHLASSLGLYKPEDFKAEPKTYCGIAINTTPCDSGSCEYKSIV